MSTTSPIFWVVLIGGLAFGLFQVKHAVQRLEDELATLNRDLLASEEATHVLRAEWAYLNRPERLAELAGRHLDLAPATPRQVGGVDTLPLRATDETDLAPRPAVLTGIGTAP